MSPSPDTIYALSSGRLPAAIAVVRISGPRAADALRALTGRVPEARRAALARVRDPSSGEIIDEALALWFPGPKSETGEDVAELQLHGGRAVLAATFLALGRMEGLRPAEAGEFTRRAFTNGQLDLTAVEGLADLIGAETEAQRRQAFRQMKGLLGDKAEDWRKRLIEALALVEAGIDFADEDLPDNLMADVRAKAQALAGEIGAALDDGHRGERLRDGLVVAIAGPPNAGKSTLLNRIAGRDVAIVSSTPGTTRDVIEVHLDLGGVPVTLLDTAGIRETDDPVELEGVNRARARAAAADLVLWVVDASAKAQVGAPGSEEVAAARSGDSPGPGPLAGTPTWLLRNKVDLVEGFQARALADLPAAGEASSAIKRGGAEHSNAMAQVEIATAESLRNISDGKSTSPIPKLKNESIIEKYNIKYDISASVGYGIDSFLLGLGRLASDLDHGEPALVTRARHRQALSETHQALIRGLSTSQDDLVAEELRLAARALGRLTGRIDVDDILDVVFRDFCIGK